jgi:hypothetical protein
MTETSTTTTYRIKGRWLQMVRSVWIILMLVTVTFFIAGVWGLYTGWHQPCNMFPQEDQASCIGTEQALHQIGFTKDFYAIYFPIGVTVATVPWILAGVLIF